MLDNQASIVDGDKDQPNLLPPPPKYHSAIGRWRHLIFGRALASSRAGETKLPKHLALPILSSNALSSVAYATEAILGILILKGTGALHFSIPIAFAICALLLIVTLSYIQIIYAYPDGGGAYPVSRDNLSRLASLVAGASLMVDYLLTVAVSVAAGVAAIIAIPQCAFLQSHIVGMCLLFILLLTIANLRGLKETGALFAIPSYIFIVGILATIVAGIISIWAHAPHVQDVIRVGHEHAMQGVKLGVQGVGWILILQAFSQGCAALTGLEAISNTVPLFQKPQDRNAAITMYWMGGLAVVMFFGLTYVADAFGAVPMDATKPGYQTIIGMVANNAWPPQLHWMFFVVQASTAVILLLAANTAFAGFPQLASMMARDSFLPRQLGNIGDRLAYSNGIVLLSIVACALIIIFKGLVDALLPMYAIGVFIGFTLAQSGMVRRWLRLRTKGWRMSLLINGFGAVCTGIVSLIIAISKFDNGEIISQNFHLGRYYPHYGVWLVIVLVPLLVAVFYQINKHYSAFAEDLSLDHYARTQPKRNVVLVLVSRLHRGVVEALDYARLVSDDTRGVYIETDPASTIELKKHWEEWAEGIPLVILESQFRSLVGPLLRYIDCVQEERDDDVVTVVIPEFVSRKWWHKLLHNQAAALLRFALFNRRDVIITNVRYFLRR